MYKAPPKFWYLLSRLRCKKILKDKTPSVMRLFRMSSVAF